MNENASTSTSTTGSKTPSAFIADGFTVSGVIQERPNLFPEFNISYRPIDFLTRDQYRQELQRHKSGTQEWALARAKQAANQIESWSLPKPATAENLLKLKPMVLDVIEALIYGLTGPDELLNESERALVKTVSADRGN